MFEVSVSGYGRARGLMGNQIKNLREAFGNRSSSTSSSFQSWGRRFGMKSREDPAPVNPSALLLVEEPARQTLIGS